MASNPPSPTPTDRLQGNAGGQSDRTGRQTKDREGELSALQSTLGHAAATERDDPPVADDGPPVERDDSPVEGDSPPVERNDPPVERDGSERYGPLTLVRHVKQDGRSLLLYTHSEDERT
jgi:hypothetical protein